MFIVGLLRWWYTIGWQQRARMTMTRLESTMDYFSIGLLLRTMFALFRQDGAGSVDGPLSVKVQAWAGRMISRVIGAMIRSTVLVMGLVTITLQALLGVCVLAVWAIVPVLPITGFVLMTAGWIPWQF
ncbi:hypothetical protein [Candidatus Mycosynbacter amalyticus]|nr:hypothetical protein [Candidatus Mycosynbacter amalyticus]